MSSVVKTRDLMLTGTTLGIKSDRDQRWCAGWHFRGDVPPSNCHVAPFLFPAMRGEGPSGNNLKSINSSPLKSPGFKRVVWVFRALVMELLNSLTDLAASSLWETTGVKDGNLFQCPFLFSLPDCVDKDTNKCQSSFLLLIYVHFWYP